MKYIKTFEGFSDLDLNSGYFQKILGSPNVDELSSNRDKFISDLIERAKLNLDSKPSAEKIEYWKKTINKVIDNYIKKGNHELDEDMIISNRKANVSMISTLLKKGSSLEKEVHDAPKYYIEEAGIETILKFLAIEDDSNFFKLPGADFKEPERLEDEDLVTYIIRKNKIPYTQKQIEDRILHYFLRRIVGNVPTERKFSNDEEATKFLKIYIHQFLYEYLIPMSKVYDKRQSNKNIQD